VVKLGIIRRIVDLKMLIKGRDLMMFLPQKGKTSSEEGGDVYLASTSTHSDHDVWLINSGASFHMTPHREWFCEYEKYNGGDVFLGDDSTTRIIGCEELSCCSRMEGLEHSLGFCTFQSWLET
jgi:hypothetical protein